MSLKGNIGNPASDDAIIISYYQQLCLKGQIDTSFMEMCYRNMNNSYEKIITI